MMMTTWRMAWRRMRRTRQLQQALPWPPRRTCTLLVSLQGLSGWLGCTGKAPFRHALAKCRALLSKQENVGYLDCCAGYGGAGAALGGGMGHASLAHHAAVNGVHGSGAFMDTAGASEDDAMSDDEEDSEAEGARRACARVTVCILMIFALLKLNSLVRSPW